MFTPGGKVYRALVKSANAVTGEVYVSIPQVMGQDSSVPLSYIDRSAVNGVWAVPTPGSTIFVATDDDEFSEVLWLAQNRATVGYVDTTITNLLPSTNPVGTVLQYAGSSAPTGYFLCNGASVSTALYPNLWNIIGYTYGGSGGTFYLPNLTGRVAVGLDPLQAEFNQLGETGGAKTHTLTTAEMPVHTHIQNQHTHIQNQHTHTQDQHTHTQDQHTHTQNQHTHTQDAHKHSMYFDSQDGGTHQHTYDRTTSPSALRAGGTLNTSGALNQTSTNTSSHNGHNHLIAGDTFDTTATNQNTTATNQNTTATNQNTTATNQNTTATNQNTTATNQDTGGGGAHNNLQPYIVLNYIIKY